MIYIGYQKLEMCFLKKEKKKELPCRLIAAFFSQKHRHEDMRNTFEVKRANRSIKSDLPKLLNDLRGEMLSERRRFKSEKSHCKVYNNRTLIQTYTSEGRWFCRRNSEKKNSARLILQLRSK